MEYPRVACFIPAKSHSERVHRKNMRKINGRTLVSIAVRKAIEAACFEAVFVDSDDEHIRSEGVEHGAHACIRPHGMSYVNGNELMANHIISRDSFDIYFQLSCTSPFLLPRTIMAACNKMIAGYPNDYESGLSVVHSREYLWKVNNHEATPMYDLSEMPPSQSMSNVLQETHGFYAVTKKAFKKHGGIRTCGGNDILFHEVSEIEAFDINTEHDMRVASCLAASDFKSYL